MDTSLALENDPGRVIPNLPEDFPPRGGLLPEGCKDLLDVIRMQSGEDPRPEALAPKVNEVLAAKLATLNALTQTLKQELADPSLRSLHQLEANPDPSFPAGTIQISGRITVKELAARMGCKWFQVIATLLNLQIFVPNGDHELSFDEAAAVAARHGFAAARED